jgi:hypothetical protein
MCIIFFDWVTPKNKNDKTMEILPTQLKIAIDLRKVSELVVRNRIWN